MLVHKNEFYSQIKYSTLPMAACDKSKQICSKAHAQRSFVYFSEYG